MDPVDMDERNRAHREGFESELMQEVEQADDDTMLEVFGVENVGELMYRKQHDTLIAFTIYACQFSQIVELEPLIREAGARSCQTIMTSFEDMANGDSAAELAARIQIDGYLRRSIQHRAPAFVAMADMFMKMAMVEIRSDWSEFNDQKLIEHIAKGAA